MSRSRRKSRFTLLLISLLAATFVLAVSTAAQSTAGREDDSAAELEAIGAKIAKAVLSKDVSTLLNFDRTDLYWSDVDALKNPKSDLYCYIFDTKCIAWKRHSVYEILSGAGRIGIKARLYKSLKGEREGLLVFYDASKVSNQVLFSKGYLCKESGRTLATWGFKSPNGRWEAETPFFDSETDSPC